MSRRAEFTALFGTMTSSELREVQWGLRDVANGASVKRSYALRLRVAVAVDLVKGLADQLEDIEAGESLAQHERLTGEGLEH